MDQLKLILLLIVMANGSRVIDRFDRKSLDGFQLRGIAPKVISSVHDIAGSNLHLIQHTAWSIFGRSHRSDQGQ